MPLTQLFHLLAIIMYQQNQWIGKSIDQRFNPVDVCPQLDGFASTHTLFHTYKNIQYFIPGSSGLTQQICQDFLK